MSATTEKLTFGQRVLVYLKGGDEANVLAVQEMAKKLWEKNIEVAKNNIKKLGVTLAEELEAQAEYLAEATIAYQESFLNITTEKLSRDSRKAYIESEWQANIATTLHQVEKIEAKIRVIKEQSEKDVKAQESLIATYTKYLNEIA